MNSSTLRWSYTLKTFFYFYTFSSIFSQLLLLVADSKSLTYTLVVAIVTMIGPPMEQNMAFAPKMIAHKEKGLWSPKQF